MKKPRYILATAKQRELLISRTCAEKAALFMGEDDWRAGEKHVKRLIASLTSDDFSDMVPMGDSTKKRVYGDVYGKVDQYGLWYIKIDGSSQVTTLVMSCHEAAEDISLAGGRTLRRKKER